jgi:hypothetical protein
MFPVCGALARNFFQEERKLKDCAIFVGYTCFVQRNEDTNVIVCLTKIDEVLERNELLWAESHYKEYVCLHFCMAQHQQRGECSIRHQRTNPTFRDQPSYTRFLK